MQKNSGGAPDGQGITDLSVTDSYVYIENGTLHCGNIDKKSFFLGGLANQLKSLSFFTKANCKYIGAPHFS